MERPYEELVVLDASGKEIIGEERMREIDARLAEIEAWKGRLDPIRLTLDRLEKGGHYASVAYDMGDGKIVFINRDGTRSALAPEQIARLFGIGPRRAAPAFRS